MLFDDYQWQAETLFEGFSSITAKIEGWSADSPQSLKVNLQVDPFAFLQELDGSTLGQTDEQPFHADPFLLLSVAGQSWTFEGEFSSGNGAADLFQAGDVYLVPENFTSPQRAAYDAVCLFLDVLYKGLCRDWDTIGEVVYDLNQSEALDLPQGEQLPPGGDHLEIEVKKGGSSYFEYLPLSEYSSGSEAICYWEIADGTLKAGELKITISDDDDELAEFDSDGIVLWRTEDELAAVINKMIEDHGGLEQYVSSLEEAA